MKYLRILVAAILVSLGFSLSSPTASNAAGLNNFTITEYKVDYYLSRTDDGHSALRTVERIKADFPSDDQNHGIERAIPLSYDGHSTHLNIQTAADQLYPSREYSTYDQNDNTVIRIGDAGSYVHGLHSYTISYTQRDVTKFYANTNDDEFYWDTNGTEWKVPITNFTATVHIEPELIPLTAQNPSCYQGASGANLGCTLVSTADGYTVKTSSLSPGENITVVFSYPAATFKAFENTLADWIPAIIILWNLAMALPALGLIMLFIYLYRRRSDRRKELTIIPPEYIPPAGTSVSTASSIMHKDTRVLAAQLLDFAVRHYIKIYETSEKTLLKPANYELEITKPIGDLLPEEQEIFTDLFDRAEVGERFDMSLLRKDYRTAQRLQNNSSKVKYSIAHEYGLRARDPKQAKFFYRWTIVFAVIGLLTLNFPILIIAITTFFCGLSIKPLTEKGLQLARYIKGLDLYISVAEADRLRMLQSPEGAQKVGSLDPNNPGQLVELYERVLPYAILFNREKEWNKRLGTLYEETNNRPYWYGNTNGVFTGAAIGAIIGGFTSSVAYSTASNTASGGSGGGGFSGGGGGGGGGGGW